MQYLLDIFNLINGTPNVLLLAKKKINISTLFYRYQNFIGPSKIQRRTQF